VLVAAFVGGGIAFLVRWWWGDGRTAMNAEAEASSTEAASATTT